MIIHIAIPRFALSGGNLVSLELAKYLESEGCTVYCLSGDQTKRANDVILRKPKRGIINSIKNIVAFVAISIRSLFLKNYIATHHLTSLFNFIKKSRYALVQDVEVDFYPNKFKWVGKILWKNYLSAKILIFTNSTLAHRINNNTNKERIDGFSFVPFEIEKTGPDEKTIDAVAIVRDGRYKDPEKTLQVMTALEKQNFKVCIINASRSVLTGENVISNVNRSDFLNILLKSKVFICMSKWEGLGLPNLEAFIAGCDVVSTPIPSAIALNDSKLGNINLVDENETVDSIVQRIGKIIQENEFPVIDSSVRVELLRKIGHQWLSYAKEKIIKGKSK